MKNNLLRIFIISIFVMGFTSSIFGQSPEVVNLPISKYFEDEDLNSGGWFTKNVAGPDQSWYVDSWDNNFFAKMSGYDSDAEAPVENEDWLISPPFNTTKYNQVLFSFSTARSSHPGDSLTVLISTDYDGTSEPGSANWTPLDVEVSDSAYEWTPDTADITSFSGTEVYAAFKYISDADSAATWEVDSINIYDPTYPLISNINHMPKYPTPDDKVGISAKVTIETGTIDTVYFSYGSTKDATEDTIPMVLDKDNIYIGKDSIPAQNDKDTTHYKIEAVTLSDDTTTSIAYSYVTSDIKVLTIKEIQEVTGDNDSSAYADSIVQTSGIVTANYGDGFFIQDAFGAWNGILIYDEGANQTKVGDEVQVIGEVVEYYNYTEIKPDPANANSFKVLSSGNPVPPPDTVTTGEANAEKYEGVLLHIEEAKCTGEANDYNEVPFFNKGDTLLLDDKIYLHEYTVDYEYNITGVLDYSFGEFKLLPRSEEDVELITNAVPQISNIQLNPSEPEANESVDVTATITDEDQDDTLVVKFYWGKSSGAITNELDFTTEGTGDDNTFAATVPGQEGGTTVYYKIQASDNDTTVIDTGNYSVAQETGIGDISDVEVKVYPNPGYGQYNLEFSGQVGNEYKVTVYNAIGNAVYQKVVTNTNNGVNTINLNQFSDGIYYLKIKSDKLDRVVKLIKQ